VRFGGGRFVATGFSGTIGVSDDGLTWSTRRENFQNFASLNDLIFAPNQWVVVGVSGVIATSPDGNTFTQQISHTTRVLSGVTFGDQYVAVGLERVTDTSPDGITWHVQ
jgi:hypothetical protein